MGITRRQFARGAAALAVLGSAYTGNSQESQPPQSSSVMLAENGWLPPPNGTVQRIAFGSCAKHWQPQPIWESVVAQNPDLFLFIGDAIYADTDGKTAWLVTEKSLRGEWNRLADKPEFQKARESFPFMATWDNHDYGSHAGGADFSVKKESQQLFLDFFGEPADSGRRNSDGIYDAKILGPEGRRVQIILLDTRYFKTPQIKDTRTKEDKAALGIVGNYLPASDRSAKLLGEAQWRWLSEQLRQPAELRLIASGTQIVADQKAMDEWGNYPLERQRLFDLIEESGADGVILLTGNVHFSEITRLDDFVYPLYDFTSSGMTHVNEWYAEIPNGRRIAGPYVDLNTGLVEIDWEAGGSPMIHLKAIKLDGSVAFQKGIPLSALTNVGTGSAE
jgi:alkaline phosphatase D